MATYFSCLALSFFGLQWAEKKKRTKQRRIQTVKLTKVVTYYL